MNDTTVLTYLLLFSTGSICGWIIEFAFRNLISARGKLSNPGLCNGPCLPIYGAGICLMYFVCSRLSQSNADPAIVCIILTIIMTLLEFTVGTVCLKFLHVRLWDYTDNWLNINGIICPLFSAFWGILACIYFFFIHDHVVTDIADILKWDWLKFFLGIFYGIFFVDFVHSIGLVAKLKKLASEYDITIHYEKLKHNLNRHFPLERRNFFIPVKSSDILRIRVSDVFNSFVSLAQHEKQEFISRLSDNDFSSWFIETESGEKLVSLKQILLYFPVYIIAYFITSKGIPIESCHPVFCHLDEVLEIMPLFVIPYISWLILVPVMSVYFFKSDMNIFRRYAKYLMYTSIAAVCVFIIFPSYMPLRPPAYPVTDLFSFLVNLIYTIDNNTNVCPSVHVIWAFGMLFASWNDKLFSKKPWRIIWCIQTFLICISTVLIKQHSVLDSLAAIPFILIGWIAIFSGKHIHCSQLTKIEKT